MNTQKKDNEQTSETEQNKEDEFQIFIGGCHPETNSELLERYFSRYGKIKNIRLMKDKTTGKIQIITTLKGKFRGFGFISFTTKEAQLRAVGKKSHTILGKEVLKNFVKKNIRHKSSQLCPKSKPD